MEKTESAIRRTSRGEARKRELADVAERVFLKHGFGETTMQMIAMQAHASKETLYRHFASKEALFSTIIHDRATNLFGPSGALETDGSPADVLFRLGFNLLQTMARPDSLALYRVVVAETPRAPELGRLFYAQGPAHVQAQLVAYLAAATTGKKLYCPDPAAACRLFLGAVIANYHTLSLVAPPSKPASCASMRKHVREAVELFMARYGNAPCG